MSTSILVKPSILTIFVRLPNSDFFTNLYLKTKKKKKKKNKKEQVFNEVKNRKKWKILISFKCGPVSLETGLAILYLKRKKINSFLKRNSKLCRRFNHGSRSTVVMFVISYDACNTVPRFTRLSHELSSSILKALHHVRSVKVSRYLMELVPCSEIPTPRKECLLRPLRFVANFHRIYIV